jgi:hypothetical protein
MTWLQALVAIGKAWAWPTVVLVAVLLFRKDLGNLIRKDLGDLVRRIEQLAGLGITLNFAKDAAETEELAKAVEPEPPNELSAPPSSRDLLQAEAQLHPTGAIIAAWSVVEVVARIAGRDSERESLESFVRRLAMQGLVPPLTGSLAHRLERLYDQAMYGRPNPEPAAAEDFVDAAWRLAATIRRSQATEPGGWLKSDDQDPDRSGPVGQGS